MDLQSWHFVFFQLKDLSKSVRVFIYGLFIFLWKMGLPNSDKPPARKPQKPLDQGCDKEA